MNWRPMWIPDRMLLVSEDKQMPPWYYGAGYRDPARRVMAFYPIPFNYLVRFKWWLTWEWHRRRSACGAWLPESEFGPTVDAAYKRGRRDGELLGQRQGFDEAIRHMERLAGHRDAE